jgi:hypothetical protein
MDRAVSIAARNASRSRPRAPAQPQGLKSQGGRSPITGRVDDRQRRFAGLKSLGGFVSENRSPRTATRAGGSGPGGSLADEFAVSELRLPRAGDSISIQRERPAREPVGGVDARPATPILKPARTTRAPRRSRRPRGVRSLLLRDSLATDVSPMPWRCRRSVSLSASAGARRYHDAHRAKGHTHRRAAIARQPLGWDLHGCLRHRVRYSEQLAWPDTPTLGQAAA